ncbi:MAG TPA: ATP-binding protein [Gammaproteobacteria bacterium]|nr:ATP-binding protein [Gammaproteobacteria bacterium]
MSLRIQLLALGLLTLVLPWTGFRYVQAMEAALRSGLERSLLASATTVAATLADRAALLCPPPRCGAAALSPGTAVSADDSGGHPLRAQTIYAHSLRSEPRVDGARDDWDLGTDTALVLPGDHHVWAGIRDRYVYLFIAVQDRDLVYQRAPGQAPYGDRLVLFAHPETDLTRWWLLATVAPGVFRAQHTSPTRFESTGSYDDRIVSAWQETAAGFSVEVRMPLNLVGSALGIVVIDVDRNSAEYVVSTSGTWDLDSTAAGAFIYQPAELRDVVVQFTRAGGRFRVLDRDGWVLADAGSVQSEAAQSASPPGSLINDLFRFVLERDDPPYPPEQPAGRIADETLRRSLEGEATTAWHRRGPGQDAIVTAAVPISGVGGGRLGAVLVEQASDSILTLTNQALVRLLTFTLSVSVLAALGLLGYATVLSLRVRRLAHAAETALGPKGEIRVTLPGRMAKDWIGDLARSFEHLLERLRGHTDYLRTLSSKLSHELRTPLAVVSTSLDNLEHEVTASSSKVYLQRLREGAERLDAILVAMSEATRLEQAIDETAAAAFDLGAVIESCCNAYRDIYPEREFVWRLTAKTTRVVGSAELVAQLLDKLVDNAVSFSAPASRIDVELAETPSELCLSVTNRGPTLPVTMRRQLFDSLVSIRDQGDGRPHLGLGLHIVALIAQFHGGRAEADDLPDRSGVVFRVWFPRDGGRA